MGVRSQGENVGRGGASSPTPSPAHVSARPAHSRVRASRPPTAELPSQALIAVPSPAFAGKSLENKRMVNYRTGRSR